VTVPLDSIASVLEQTGGYCVLASCTRLGKD
jgi:hypothetical protein